MDDMIPANAGKHWYCFEQHLRTFQLQSFSKDILPAKINNIIFTMNFHMGTGGNSTVVIFRFTFKAVTVREMYVWNN